VASYVPAAERQGEVSWMEFSRVDDGTYFYTRVTGSPSTNVLEFYKGTSGGQPPAATGLQVSISVDPQEYAPLVWHLLAVKL
jgi:hypothetical protein